MTELSKYILPLLLFLACSTNSIRPPNTKINDFSFSSHELSFDSVIKNSKSENQKWFALYLVSKISNSVEEKCKALNYLKKHQEFPIKELISIRNFEYCIHNKKDIYNYWNNTDIKSISYYYRELLTDISIQKSILINDKNSKIKFLIQKISLLKKFKEKEKFVELIIKEAKKISDKKLQKQIKELTKRYMARKIKGNKKKFLFKVARDFERHRNFSKARFYYKKLLINKKERNSKRLKAYKRLVFTYKLERNLKKYIYELKGMFKWYKKELKNDKRLKREILRQKIIYARALWTREIDVKQSIKVLKKVIKNKKYSNRIANALFVLAAIELDKSNYHLALSYLKKATRLKITNNKLKMRIIWATAWNYYQIKKYSKAIKYFSLGENEAKNPFQKEKFIFWRGKAFKELNEKYKANQIFNELVSNSPYSYYGIVSSMETDKRLPSIKAPTIKKTEMDIELDWLIKLNEIKLAKSYLQFIQSKYRKTVDIKKILPWYQNAKWYSGGISKFFTIKKEERKEVLNEFFNIPFPLPNKEIIVSIAKKRNISPSLIFSIARQESAFNDHARSWADAFGLLQVIPSKAKKIAKKINIPYRSFHDLYNVKTNIEIGSYLLGKLFHKYNRNFIAMAASYNAGEKAIERWYKNRYRLDPLEFIEMIPYEETKGYIKLVFRNYTIYERLMGKHLNLKTSFFNHNKF